MKIKLIIRLAFIALILLNWVNPAFSSDNPLLQDDGEELHWRAGLTGDLNYNLHYPGFNSLRGIPSCCPEYKFGKGTGYNIGGLFELPVSENIFFGLETLYRSIDGKLVYVEDRLVNNSQNEAVKGKFEHSIDSKISLFEIQPYVSYGLTDKISLKTGIGIGFIDKAKFNQTEKILDPGDIRFENDLRTRMTYSGEIPNTSAFNTGFIVGLNYALPLNSVGNIHLLPEIAYEQGFTDLINSDNWKVGSISLGVSLRYSHAPNLSEAVMPGTPLPDPAPEPDIKPIAAKLDAGLKTFFVDSENVEKPAEKLIVRNIVSVKPYAPLNYIFFENSSSEIPGRYARIEPEETDDFDFEQFNGVNTLEVYYHILNIIGKNMQRNPKISMTITGCNSNTGAEENNLPLSKARAENVAGYFKDVWDISPDRINIESRNLPANPSTPDSEDGLAENRRVEITFDNNKILEPIVFYDTTKTVNFPKMRIKPDVFANKGISKWQVKARQGGETLFSKSGQEDLPRTLEWDMPENENFIPANRKPMYVSLNVEDNEKNFQKVSSDPIKVKQVVHQETRIEQYSLIIFDFNTSEISDHNRQILDIVRESIEPESKVTIQGYTDRTGDIEYNKQLSQRRAEAIAEALNIDKFRAKGVGNSVLLFPNDTPEGRFYCRTVRITIETPLK